jgi:DNA/RNA-binding domain of Phe-tRNA-synthetase-like protein
VVKRFETFRVGVIVSKDLVIQPNRTPELEQLVHKAEETVASAIGDVELGDISELKCWRIVYRAFGEKKTGFRSSVEWLIKGVQQGKGIPRICNLVDLYNTVSILFRMPVGADDLDKVAQPMGFRFSRPGDTFIPLGKQDEPDPPFPGEVVYADAEKCLCRRWNWYQDARSAINNATTRTVLTVQALEPNSSRIEEATSNLCSLLVAHCGSRNSWTILDRAHPEVIL